MNLVKNCSFSLTELNYYFSNVLSLKSVGFSKTGQFFIKSDVKRCLKFGIYEHLFLNF